jgi:hypothetical protein
MSSTAISYLVEKCVIGFALLAGLPLFVLDEEIIGIRRYVWLGASIQGLCNLLFVTPDSTLSNQLDKLCLSLLCVAWVPHFIQLVKDQQWMGLGVLPPLFMVIGQGMNTQINDGQASSEDANSMLGGVSMKDYWKLRAFLHFSAYILPYLNHLPSSSSSSASTETEENAMNVEVNKSNDPTSTTTTSKKKPTKPKTNKKKR